VTQSGLRALTGERDVVDPRNDVQPVVVIGDAGNGAVGVIVLRQGDPVTKGVCGVEA
jgi:hypothetical protein